MPWLLHFLNQGWPFHTAIQMNAQLFLKSSQRKNCLNDVKMFKSICDFILNINFLSSHFCENTNKLKFKLIK